jgi:acyl carrier protein
VEDKSAAQYREQVIKVVIDIFVRVVGFVAREEVSSTTNPTKDLHIDTDDLSLFIAKIERHFDIDVAQSEWDGLDGTLGSVANLVLRHRSNIGPGRAAGNV